MEKIHNFPNKPGRMKVTLLYCPILIRKIKSAKQPKSIILREHEKFGKDMTPPETLRVCERKGD